VNCLEPHPQIPVLATCGLDEDVKIWVPSCEQEPTMTGLRSVSSYATITVEPHIYTFLGIDGEWCKLQEMQKS
jgi:hypothetical protein